ncbi:DUF3465 domain-containing protein [Halarcobacter sp.]|uniref:DUF3465 domain-containing protein n=1 Tax=Halarcobacter sp. TaxID=2321133 RepID=UPI003A951FC5
MKSKVLKYILLIGLIFSPTFLLSNDSIIQNAFFSSKSDVQVKGSGKVIKILSDDNKGSRHQRFIIKLKNQMTLLVAHNIDLAPRINSLRVNDYIEFYGEYEWNSKGGVIHWTHKDYRGNHPHGWIKHKGITYE